MNPSVASSSSTALPPPRVTPNVAHAFGGIWRLTIRRYFTPGHWLAVGGMLAVLALFAFGASTSMNRLNHYVSWIALFYVCFLVPVLSFISAAGLLRDDLNPGSVDYVFTRPVSRPLFVLFRYVCHVICVQLDFLLALAVVLGVGVARGVPDLADAVPLLLLGQVTVIAVFSAFGFFCGMLTARYVILGLSYAGAIEVGIGNIPTQLNRISMIRHAREILRPLLGDQRIGMGGPLAVAPLSSSASLALLAAFVVGLLGLTVLLFSYRELAGPTQRDA